MCCLPLPSSTGPAPPSVLAKKASMTDCKDVTTTGVAPASRAQPGSRKSRASCTPRAIRRGKCRSKSETLADVNVRIALGGDASPLPPRSVRSVSDSFVTRSSHHELFSAPVSISNSSTSSSENVSVSIGSTLQHVHSFDWSSSLASDSPSSDLAIDSDILSVLADYDSCSDMEDATEFGNGGPLSSASFRSDAAGFDNTEDDDTDMLMTSAELGSYSFVRDTTPSPPAPASTGLRINDLFRRAEELGVGNRGVDLDAAFAAPTQKQWPSTSGNGGVVDARFEAGGYLSTHMEKMSMLQQQQQHVSSPMTSGGTDTSLLTLLDGSTSEMQQVPVVAHDVSSDEQGLHATPLNPLPAQENHHDAGAPLPDRMMGRLENFASVSVDAFTVKEVTELEPEDMDICDDASVKDEIFPLEILSESVGVGVAASLWKRESGGAVDAAVLTPLDLEPAVLDSCSPTKRKAVDSLWPKSLLSASCWAALEAQNQYVDDLFHEAITTERKTQSIGGFSAHHDPATHAFPTDKLVAGGGILGELLFDVSEYGLEDTRMGSPLLCQQEEL